MIASPTRLALPISRQAFIRSSRSQITVRKSFSPLLRNFTSSQRRCASGESASDKVKAAAESVKATTGSDAPWAIGSVLFFGSLFIYLTSPPKGGKKGHGGEHGAAASHDAEEDEEESSGSEEEESEFFVPKKIEDKPEAGSNAPPGSHALAERSMTAEEGAHRQKVTKQGSSGRPDDITFKKGIAAAKEGHSGEEDSHISDPKKVVAAAHKERESRKSAKSENSDQDEKESEDVHNSPQAADANAQNENSEEDKEESKKIHDSENAKKANAINEAEGSDKPDDDD